MDLNSGQVITCSCVTEIPIMNVVIKAVEQMAEQQGFKSLKFKNHHGVVFFDTDWIAGVDYDDNDNDYDDYDDQDDDDYNDNDDDDNNNDDEEYNKTIKQEELNEVLAEAKESNPAVPQEDVDNDVEEDQDAEEDQEDQDNTSNSEEEEEEETEVRHSSQERVEPERLVPTMTGKSYLQAAKTTVTNNKTVTFKDEQEKTMSQLEYCHNLITQVHPNPHKDVEYATDHAMLIARVIDDLNTKVTIQGASYAQQYILQKGLKKFGEHGEHATSKELDQLHRCNCFTPISINEMTQSEHKKAMEALMFLTKKRNRSIKGRLVYNGKPTRKWLTREDSASPTAALESIMLTAVIDAHEG